MQSVGRYCIYIDPTSSSTCSDVFFILISLLSLTSNFLFDKPVRNGGILIIQTLKHDTALLFHRTRVTDRQQHRPTDRQKQNNEVTDNLSM